MNRTISANPFLPPKELHAPTLSLAPHSSKKKTLLPLSPSPHPQKDLNPLFSPSPTPKKENPSFLLAPSPKGKKNALPLSPPTHPKNRLNKKSNTMS